MFELSEVMGRAAALAGHAAARQALVAENVANADTPGYRPRDLAPFADTYHAADGAAMRRTRTGHLGDGPGAARDGAALAARTALSPGGNGVSIEREMVAAGEVRREHDLALAVYRSSLTLLRSSLGRT
jgi:flagellar basal-body rod protein FlgB